VGLFVDPRVDDVLRFGLESCDLLLSELDMLIITKVLLVVAVVTVKPQLGLAPLILPISKARGVAKLGLLVGGVLASSTVGSRFGGLRGLSYSKRFHLFPRQLS
jgi:hypothetical protein